MRRFRIHERAPLSVQAVWYNLAFTAGMINAGGFLSCHRFVSHVTGFVTITGVELVRHSWTEALGAITIPIFFTLGAMISAWFTEARPGESNPRPMTNALVIVALIMLSAAVLGNLGAFGRFGITDDILQDYFMLAILSLACGIQNAVATTATGASIRPTHLTGTATDLGIGAVRALIERQNYESWHKELTTAKRRLFLVLAFVVGAITGAWIFSKVEYNGFILPFATSTLAVLMSRSVPKTLDASGT